MLVLGGIRVRQSQSLQEMQAPVGDVLAADLNETLASNPTSMLGRINELGAAQLPEGAFDNAPVGIYGDPSLEPMPSPNLDAGTARQRVKDAGLEGLIEIPEKGLPELAVDILIRRKKEERERQSTQARAPGGLGVGLLRLGTALAGSALDPINVGTAFLPVVSGARYADWLASRTTLLGRAGVRAGVGAIEGAAGAALVEPLVLAGKKLEQGDYGLYDSFLNVTLGSVLGAGLHAGSGLLSDLTRPGSISKVMSEMPPEAREAVLAQAIGARVEGGAVRADAVLETLAKTDERVARVLERDRAQAAAAAEPSKAGASMDDDLRVAYWYEEVKRLRALDEPRGESLASFIREKGGIRSTDLEGSEVRAAVQDANLPPGFWNDKAGKNADDMALAAWEAGYIGDRTGDRPSLREFYDALRQEASGQRIYPVETRDRLDADAAQAARMEDELSSSGLTLNDDAMKVARALAAREKQALSELPEPGGWTRETEDPAYLAATREADEAAALFGLEPDARLARATEEVALAEERLGELERAGLLNEDDKARLRAADEAVQLADAQAAAMKEGALCMARAG